MSDNDGTLAPYVHEGEIVDGEVAGRVRVLALTMVLTLERRETVGSGAVGEL